jgi:hypothetical protein
VVYCLAINHIWISAEMLNTETIQRALECFIIILKRPYAKESSITRLKRFAHCDDCSGFYKRAEDLIEVNLSCISIMSLCINWDATNA